MTEQDGGKAPYQGDVLANRLPVILIDDLPGPSATAEAWQFWMDELQATDDFQGKDQYIQHAKQQIVALKRRARRKSLADAAG
jgi:hypothetical protein